MKEIKLLCWNVNGIRALVKKGFLEWLQKESPDILCLQETKASPENLNERPVRTAKLSNLLELPGKKGLFRGGHYHQRETGQDTK